MTLLPLQPFSQPERLPVPSEEPSSIVSHISSYYTFLTTLPHISASWLHLPPASGWPDFDHDTLRSRNRSDEVIDLVRHLPYFQRPLAERGNPDVDRSVFLGPDTLSIAYPLGHAWDDRSHEKCPTPGHVIWLAKMERWDGTALLLDVKAGTITEFSFQAQGPPLIPVSERNALPLEDRWMTHPTWSVSAYFSAARQHYERLIYIPKPASLRDLTKWDFAVRMVGWQRDEDGTDGEYVPAHDGNLNEGSDDEGDGGEGIEGEGDEDEDVEMQDDDDDDEQIVPDDEVSALMDDAGAQGTRASSTNDAPRVFSRGVTRAPPDNDENKPAWQRTQERNWNELMEIYRRHGWPGSEFDKEACTRDLREWNEMADRRRKEEEEAKRRAAAS